MVLYTLVLVALIQGLTEFLPVSSTGHLALVPLITGAPYQGVVIDAAAHVGTLAAVVTYFWREVSMAASGVPAVLRGRIDTQASWLALCLLVATVPVVTFGALLKLSGAADALRTLEIVGWATLLFGLLLWVADRRGRDDRSDTRWSLRHAVTLGLWQAVALIPGASRSGIVITGARFAGYDRVSAARLSMLMSVPTIIASGLLAGADVIGGQVDWADALAVVILSAIAGFIALGLMMRFLKSYSYTPYVLYRIGLGTFLLALAYSGVI
ncbi:MAG: undecaprenyl-diphosphate phosphatase [Pseudomonadota bacterium]